MKGVVGGQDRKVRLENHGCGAGLAAAEMAIGVPTLDSGTSSAARCPLSSRKRTSSPNPGQEPGVPAMCGVIVAGGYWRIRPQTFLRDTILIDHMHLKTWMSARSFIRCPFPLLSKPDPPFFFFYKKKFSSSEEFLGRWMPCNILSAAGPPHAVSFRLPSVTTTWLSTYVEDISINKSPFFPQSVYLDIMHCTVFNFGQCQLPFCLPGSWRVSTAPT